MASFGKGDTGATRAMPVLIAEPARVCCTRFVPGRIVRCVDRAPSQERGPVLIGVAHALTG